MSAAVTIRNVVRLGDVATIERSSVDPNDIRSGTRYVGLEHIDGEGQFVNVASVSPGDLASTKFSFTAQHILYGKLRPYLRKIARPHFAGICSTDILPILPGPRVDRDYLTYFLRQPSIVDLATSRSSGANLPRISPTVLADFRLPLPTLKDQRRVASILGRADALRSARRRTLALHANLKLSLFLDTFGDPATNPKRWPLRPISEIAVKISDGPFGSNLKTSHYTESGIRVIRLQNIGVSEFLDEDKAYISELHFASLRKHECVAGDVLVGTLGDPNLRACIMPATIGLAINKADCVQIRPNPSSATSEFVCALLNLPSTERMATGMIHGQTRSRISMGRLRELVIPVPPIQMQREFTERTAKAEVLRAAALTSAVDLDRLFSSLQSRAFRGEL